MNLDRVWEQNNWLETHTATSSYNRLAIWEPENEYKFYDVKMNPLFMGNSYKSSYFQSTDNEKTFKDVENLHLYGVYFFLADQV